MCSKPQLQLEYMKVEDMDDIRKAAIFRQQYQYSLYGKFCVPYVFKLGIGIVFENFVEALNDIHMRVMLRPQYHSHQILHRGSCAVIVYNMGFGIAFNNFVKEVSGLVDMVDMAGTMVDMVDTLVDMVEMVATLESIPSLVKTDVIIVRFLSMGNSLPHFLVSARTNTIVLMDSLYLEERDLITRTILTLATIWSTFAFSKKN